MSGARPSGGGRIWAALGVAALLALALPVWVTVRGLADAPASTPAKAQARSPEAKPEPVAAKVAAKVELDGAVDETTHLIREPGYAQAAAQCTGCHSGQLVAQNRGDRAHWTSLFRWMQKTQNLPTFSPDVERQLLDYLAQNYGPAPNRLVRRAPLPDALLPPAR